MSLKVVQYHLLSLMSGSYKSCDPGGTRGIIKRVTNNYDNNNYGVALWLSESETTLESSEEVGFLS